MPSNLSSATNPLAYAKCPYCDKSFCTHGGGIANHIWRSPFCCRKKHQWLKSLVAKVRSVAVPGTQHHIPAPSLPSKVSLEHSNGAPNTQQDFQDSLLDGLDNISMSGADLDNSTAGSAPQQFCIVHDQKNAGFVFPGHKKTLWQHLWSHEQPGARYAPWKSKAEWELVHWLSTSQLSQSNIDHFLKLPWVRFDFLFGKFTRIHIQDLGPGSSSSTEITLPDAPNEPQMFYY